MFIFSTDTTHRTAWWGNYWMEEKFLLLLDVPFNFCTENNTKSFQIMRYVARTEMRVHTDNNTDSNIIQ